MIVEVNACILVAQSLQITHRSAPKTRSDDSYTMFWELAPNKIETLSQQDGGMRVVLFSQFLISGHKLYMWMIRKMHVHML